MPKAYLSFKNTQNILPKKNGNKPSIPTFGKNILH